MNRRALLLLPVIALSSEAFAQNIQWTMRTYWDELKKRMGIKPHQEAAWKKYSMSIDQASAQSGGHDSSMLEAMGTATWHERCQMMNRSFKGEQAADVARKAAAELLPVLDTQQKAAAPAVLPGVALPPGPGFG
jgi:hypothetical protein